MLGDDILHEHNEENDPCNQTHLAGICITYFENALQGSLYLGKYVGERFCKPRLSWALFCCLRQQQLAEAQVMIICLQAFLTASTLCKSQDLLGSQSFFWFLKQVQLADSHYGYVFLQQGLLAGTTMQLNCLWLFPVALPRINFIWLLEHIMFHSAFTLESCGQRQSYQIGRVLFDVATMTLGR